MDSSEYRRQYAEELKRQTEGQLGYQEFLEKSNSLSQRLSALATRTSPLTEEELAASLDILRDQKEEPALRASALRAIGREIGNREESINVLLELLQDKTQPREVRVAALQALQMLAFISPLFMSKRPEFLAALRTIVDDPDGAIRQAALEILAMEKDEYGQRRLNEGLDDPSRALVTPEKAVQLLGQDVHADLYPRLREMIQNPPSPEAREEAVRLLAGDPESRELLVSLLKDKDEDLKIRTFSAVALQSLDPAEFTEQAREIVLDNTEQEPLRLTGLNGLTHFSDPAASLLGDSIFDERIRQLIETSPSSQLREAAEQYLIRRR